MPGLAESYEANEDATEFIFHLRQGVTFHDGTPFNAAAVKSIFDRAGNPENHLKRQSLFAMVDHTDVVDDYTVKVVLKYPFGAFVNDIAHPGALIVSPKAVQKYGKEMRGIPSGTGPYQFVSWSADTLKLKKNQHYWKPGSAEDRHDHLSQHPGERRAARHAAGRRGAVHLPVPPEMIKSLDNSPTITIFDEPSILGRYVALNTMRKPFDDLRVRQALNYAVDKNAYIKVVFSGYADTDGLPDAPGLGRSTRSRAPGPTIPRRRRRCWPRPAIPTGSKPHDRRQIPRWRSAACSSCSSNLRAVGVKVTVEALEAGVLTAKDIQRPEARGRHHRHALHRLVVFHRRCRLGHAADALHQVVPAGAVQPRLVQQPGRRTRRSRRDSRRSIPTKRGCRLWQGAGAGRGRTRRGFTSSVDRSHRRLFEEAAPAPIRPDRPTCRGCGLDQSGTRISRGGPPELRAKLNACSTISLRRLVGDDSGPAGRHRLRLPVRASAARRSRPPGGGARCAAAGHRRGAGGDGARSAAAGAISALPRRNRAIASRPLDQDTPDRWPN